VLPKEYVVFHHYDIVCIVRVILFQMLKNFKLDSSLVLEFLFVSDQLDRYNFTCLMVHTFKGLSEASFTNELKDLKSESYLILHDNIIVSPFIIIAIVVLIVR
jgi:hypothetical protein